MTAAGCDSLCCELCRVCVLQAPWDHVPPQQVREMVLAQKRPAVPADAKYSTGAIMSACWNHRPARRPAMADVVNDLLHSAFNYLWDTNSRGTLTEGGH